MNNRLRPLHFRRALVPVAGLAVAALCAPAASAAVTVSGPALTVVSPATGQPAPPAPLPGAPSLPAAGPSTLSITGNGSVEIAPDVATLSIEVRSTSATATGARSKANARTNAVLAAITKLGIDRGAVQTSGISLSRSQVAATRHHPAHKLYAASNDLTVRTTNVALVGPLVDAVTRAGADSVDGPDFSFGDPSAGQAAATRAALADARSRADDAAAAIGYKVLGVVSVAINPQDSSIVAPQAAAAPALAALKAPTPTPVDAGQQEVDATVDVVYLIAPTA
jgi:uncharacterized protein YggE